MGRGSTDLDNYEYDKFLAANKKEKELRERKVERRSLNSGYKGWHFGIDKKPVYTRDKEEFRKELDKRGLMMEDDIKHNRKSEIVNPKDMARLAYEESRRRNR